MLTSVPDNPEKNVEMCNIKDKHLKTHKNTEKLTKTFKKTHKGVENCRKRGKMQTYTKKYASGGTLGVPWARFGRSWALLGRSWGALGCSRGAFGSLLGASWPPLGRNLENRPKKNCFGGSNLEAKIHPSWVQIPLKIHFKKQIDFGTMFSYFFYVFHRFPLQSKNRRFCKK